VRGLLRQLTGSDIGLADDLAQETFLRAYKNLRGFRGEARFSTWLYRIAYNCFREHARKRKELVGIDEEQLESEHDPQTADPALRHDLMHALNLLPLHERTAVVLCCQNGLSHDEAARVLDIPLGTNFNVLLSGGLAAAWVHADASWNDVITLGASSAPSIGHGQDDSGLLGYYAALNLSWDLNEDWSAILGAQYQHLDAYRHDFGGRTVEADFENSVFVTFGFSYRY